MPKRKSTIVKEKYGHDEIFMRAKEFDSLMRKARECIFEACEIGAPIYDANTLNAATSAGNWSSTSINRAYQYNVKEFNISEKDLESIALNDANKFRERALLMFNKEASDIIDTVINNMDTFKGKNINIMKIATPNRFVVQISNSNVKDSISVNDIKNNKFDYSDLVKLSQKISSHNDNSTYQLLIQIKEAINKYISE